MPDGGPGGRARQFPPEVPESATLARPRAVGPSGGADIDPFGVTDSRASGRTDQDGSGRTYPVGIRAGGAGRRRRGKSGRMLALSAGGVLMVAVGTAAALDLSHAGGTPAPALTTGSQSVQSGIAQDPLGPGPDPGKPTVMARSIGGQQVEFSWTYANSAPNDSFRVQVIGSSGKPPTPKKPDLVLSVAQGQQVCIEVLVISANGVESPESSVSCWPTS